MIRLTPGIACVATLALGLPLFAQDAERVTVNWIQVSTSPAPPGTCCFGMAYDYARQSVVLFGGSADPPYLDDTWILTDQ